MRHIILPLALSIAVCACQPKKQHEGGPADSVAVDTVAATNTENQLPDSLSSSGWKALFDGTSTKGWRFFKNKENNSWEVSDGTLHCKPFVDNAENKRSDIITNGQYENFELLFTWKISAQGNSGVMFHVSEEFDEPYASGPEYQVIDDKGYPGELQDNQLTGANYGLDAPSSNVVKPVGEWNESKLVVNKKHVEHWLNGTKVVEYELGSDAWKKGKATGKWKDFPGYGLSATGHIAFQDHSQEVWFKNIFLKPL